MSWAATSRRPIEKPTEVDRLITVAGGAKALSKRAQGQLQAARAAAKGLIKAGVIPSPANVTLAGHVATDEAPGETVTVTIGHHQEATA